MCDIIYYVYVYNILFVYNDVCVYCTSILVYTMYMVCMYMSLYTYHIHIYECLRHSLFVYMLYMTILYSIIRYITHSFTVLIQYTIYAYRYNVTPEIEETLCRIILTGDYCIDTVPQLESIMKVYTYTCI